MKIHRGAARIVVFTWATAACINFGGSPGATDCGSAFGDSGNGRLGRGDFRPRSSPNDPARDFTNEGPCFAVPAPFFASDGPDDRCNLARGSTMDFEFSANPSLEIRATTNHLARNLAGAFFAREEGRTTLLGLHPDGAVEDISPRISVLEPIEIVVPSTVRPEELPFAIRYMSTRDGKELELAGRLEPTIDVSATDRTTCTASPSSSRLIMCDGFDASRGDVVITISLGALRAQTRLLGDLTPDTDAGDGGDPDGAADADASDANDGGAQ